MKRVICILLALATALTAACAEGKGALTRFYCYRWGEMPPEGREVFWEDGGWWLRENEEAPRPFPAELAAELELAVSDYGMDGWSGDYSTEYEVLDGECFSLELEYADGTTVSASGNNAFPERYFEAMNALDDLFRREKRGALAGTYRYEGEGFGGDFTITLNADGTYAFYEGPLSSYMGAGDWSVDYGAVYMNEGEAGFDVSFLFMVEGDSLVYIAAGSDAFPYVKLPDGARFVREGEEEAMKLLIDGTRVPVTWEDNTSVAELKGLLPLTIEMSMYGGFEQVGPIGRSLTRDDRQTTTQAGDIVLYAGNQIVVFYGSNSWAYTRLGHIDLPRQEMENLLGYGDVTITITED